MIVTSIFKYKFNPILLSGYLVIMFMQKYAKIRPIININVETEANIRTKLFTLSFQRNARTKTSPIIIIKKGTRDIRLSALVRKTRLSIYVKATTKVSDTIDSMVWNKAALSMLDLYTTGIAIENMTQYISEYHIRKLSPPSPVFSTVLSTIRAIKAP